MKIPQYIIDRVAKIVDSISVKLSWVMEEIASKQAEKELNAVRQIPISELAIAMAEFEGFYISGSVAQRHNNPCNLRYSKFQTGNKNNFSLFDSPERGFKACEYDLACKSRGKTNTSLTGESTIRDLVYVWAPTTDNNPNNENYIKHITKKLKVKDSYKLKGFIHN